MAVRYLGDLDVLDVDVVPLLPRLRIQSWERGMEVHVLIGDTWRPARTSRGILLIPQETRGHPFFGTIPEEALRWSLDCGAHQLAALRLLRQVQAAWDLAGVRNFLWLIARRLDARHLDVEALAAILSRRRHEVLSWCLGVDVPPAAVRLLGKCHVSDRAEASYRILRRALTSPLVRRVLGRVPIVSCEQLSFVLRNPELAQLPCYVEGLTPPYPGLPDVVTMHRRTLQLGVRLGIRNSSAMVRAARYGDLLEMYVRWTSRYEERLALEDLVGRFGDALPAPPFPGNDDIVPIVSARELLEEAAQMHHCVLMYAEPLYRGELAVYRVLRPQRATVMLAMPESQIVELSGVMNEGVSEECHRAVEDWLAEAQSARIGRTSA